jgi:hypothetical protein
MAKDEARMTKQIRVYEDTADFINEIVRRKPTNTTYADVVEEAFRKAYPELYDDVVGMKKQAQSKIDTALGTPRDDQQ